MKGLEVVSLEKGQPWRQRSERAPRPQGGVYSSLWSHRHLQQTQGWAGVTPR